MTTTEWRVRFGDQQVAHARNRKRTVQEFFVLIEDQDRNPIDTFYSQDAGAVFDEVAALMKAEASRARP